MSRHLNVTCTGTEEEAGVVSTQHAETSRHGNSRGSKTSNIHDMLLKTPPQCHLPVQLVVTAN